MHLCGNPLSKFTVLVCCPMLISPSRYWFHFSLLQPNSIDSVVCCIKSVLHMGTRLDSSTHLNEGAKCENFSRNFTRFYTLFSLFGNYLFMKSYPAAVCRKNTALSSKFALMWSLLAFLQKEYPQELWLPLLVSMCRPTTSLPLSGTLFASHLVNKWQMIWTGRLYCTIIRCFDVLFQ